MSRKSAVSAIERGDLSELQHVLEESEWDIGSEPLGSKGQTALHIACANGHLDIVQYLVMKIMRSVTVKDGEIFGLVHRRDHIPHSEEALQIARSSGNLHIVLYLLKHYQCEIPDDISDVHLACMMGDMDTVKTANGSSILGTADRYGTTPIHYATLEPNILRMIVQYAGEMLLNIADKMGNNPLHHSIKYECIESVTILIQSPQCDVNLTNLKGETPLITACKQSSSAVVQLLVASKRCDLNTTDKKANTALHVAVSNKSVGQLENVQCLLQSDRCDPNVINKSGRTPLHIVCHRGDIPLLEALVADKRCDLNIQDGNGDTALHIGVENVEVVKCLLESGCSRCDIYNEKGLTPFHKAIITGVMASVEIMMKNGVNILQTSNDIVQCAPIHIACIYSRLDILKVLLSCESCDPNQQNYKGDTALHIVCRMRTGRELQFLEVLTSTPGIYHTLMNLEGNAPIHTACMNSRLESLKVLLSCENCDPNQQNIKGDTALHIVCRMRTGSELQFLEVLISTSGINSTIVNNEGIVPFEVVGNDGNTPLHNTCAEGNAALVELLMKKGVDIQKSNGQGDAPIHIACKCFQLNSLKTILGSKDCDPNQQNREGNTALHIVCRMRTGSELQFLDVLTSTPGINLTIVNNKGIVPFEVVGNDGNTPLHNACAEGNAALVELLMKKGVDIQKSNGQGDAPIHIACKWFQLNSLKAILGSKDCDPNQKNAVGDTALHIVCRKRTGSELQFLEVLTSTPGINPTIVNHEGIGPSEIVDRDGNTLLHYACVEGNIRVAQLLLKYGADV